jgi:hypothetical protein
VFPLAGLVQCAGSTVLTDMLTSLGQLMNHADNIRVRTTVVAEGFAALLRVLVVTAVSAERDALLQQVGRSSVR